MTKQILVGGVPIGGGAPVPIQSMTNTPTQDVEATVQQIRRLSAAGCQIVRVAVPNMAAAKAVGAIKEQIDLPLVVDIHFNYKLALECIEAGADKVRINPGNIGDAERVKAVAHACARKNIPIRIGVNGGSLEKPLLEKYGGVTPQALVDSAFGHIALLNRYDFDDICVSLKSSSVPITMQAYQLMSQQSDYPLHLGVTEAGTTRMGTLKSAAGIGGLLALGIGDTLRVTLTADPVEEITAAKDILKAVGLRRDGPDLIACPTCGRTKIDLIPLARAVEKRLKDVKKPITVAVMGCVVNGPGEASAADVGIAGGSGFGILFRQGQVVKKVPQEALLDELMALIDEIP
ncbi:flavodoxin-dependent (E)-4-hydroxy-3-methylbut-2-enyl-diphosphate synthase [Evtepia sp.]|uniref:flavodoxin-dependent (E)-4-hydroxy-3-methylbut-2-enyl-diphosphate synthase n=1 Tax=Evtepia sp. TaxID=2773933 RepID=UPI002A7F4153|nr:flavodoxin-dependent (E)-4-hydroxy-3-methylbut-2-enyl-diphosphate synthase [Evtepia sp.]MDY4430563.1 flavodoxin-dependent (E)-4-hydroxy-3-methylbut-2-enyl-diphosphate synthase [Evtepia sp.]